MLSIVALLVGGACALIISFDETRRPQHMAVMYAVWPLTALFGGALWLWAYFAFGRGAPPDSHSSQQHSADGVQQSMAAAVFKGSSHCGAGCTLGDIVAEWTIFAAPVVATWFGYGTLFREKTFALWIPDFILAYGIGIAFQYYAIKPMRDLSVGEALKQALKADTASIVSWQIGMYGAMAIIQFGLLRPAFGNIAPVNSPEFWFVMQIAMLAGFATAFPVNWWLVSIGVKEKM